MKKLICIIIFVALTIGCGPRFIYPHLDWLIPWYIDDYISLDSDQSSMLRSRLLMQLDWHCRTQLSIYADSLRDLAAGLENTDQQLTYTILNDHYATFLKHWKGLMIQIAPDVTDILIGLVVTRGKQAQSMLSFLHLCQAEKH